MAYYRTTIARRTGTPVTVGTADELGLDPDGGRWVTVCEPHGSIVNHLTLEVARSHASQPDEWCWLCQAARLDGGPLP